VSTLDFEVRVLVALGLLDGGSGLQVGPYVGAHNGLVDGSPLTLGALP